MTRVASMFFASALAALLGAACGARSGLPTGVDGEGGAGGEGGSHVLPPPDASVDAPVDAALDASVDAPMDAAIDAPMDAAIDAPMDAAIDAPLDASLDAPTDAPMDALVDAAPDAPMDAAIPEDCQDAGVTYIYLIASDNELLRFDPASLTTASIGVIDCPLADPTSGATPYSMAVDRKGIAYVVYTDGELFRVSTATASCEATTFVIGQGGFSTEFGMGFSADNNDPGETLFIAGNASMQLASLDTTTFSVSPIGVFSSPIGEAELTGTGGGDLYAFGLVVANNMTSAIHLAHIDKPTATVLSDTVLTVDTGMSQIFDWAFAYWGGDFYFFTSTDGSTTDVSRYTPGGTMAIPTVAMINHAVVGAGVSTCAPQQ